MSKIALTPNASGTGTFTIASPNGNTDRTINLPDSNGTILTTATAGVPIGGPAFSAYQSTAQTVSSATATKLLFQTEEFDTNSNFDSSTFTPTVSGYYQISAAVSPGVSSTVMSCRVHKNGSEFKRGSVTSNTAGVSVLVYCNGSTDYIEIYGYLTAGQALSALDFTTYFQGVLVRSAT